MVESKMLGFKMVAKIEVRWLRLSLSYLSESASELMHAIVRMIYSLSLIRLNQRW